MSGPGSGLEPDNLDTEALAEAFEQLAIATSSLARALRPGAPDWEVVSEPSEPVPQASSAPRAPVPQASSPQRAPVPQASASPGPASRAPSSSVPVPQASAGSEPAFIVTAPPCTSFTPYPSGSRQLRFRAPNPPAVPSDQVSAECLHLCSSLASAVRFERAQRAWDAGRAAARVFAGELDCVPASPEISVKSRWYVILRNPRGSPPAVYRDFSSYKLALGVLLPGTTCHGFPTEGEARTYCKAAGRPFPSDQ